MKKYNYDYKKYLSEKICSVCGIKYKPTSWNSTMTPYCSEGCKNIAQEKRRKIVILSCLECGKQVEAKGSHQLSLARKGRAYCSEICKKEFLRKVSAKTMAKTNHKYASERMKKNNPMSNPTTLEKMRSKLKGRPFLHRGGNGKLTKQQLALWKELKLPLSAMELPIKTSPVKNLFPLLPIPTCYKVDIGILENKIAIEVDGNSHNLKTRRLLDNKKDEVLKALGWKVLRFTNEQIDEDLKNCVQTVLSNLDLCHYK